MAFIKKYQPLLTIHGHIHESPEYSHMWKKKIGDTLCVQAGQMDRTLYYTMIDVDDGVKDIRHSIYG